MTIVERVNRLGKRHSPHKHFVKYEYNGWGMATVYYRLAAFGQIFRFRLERDASFLSPALNVEHIYGDFRRLPFSGNLQHCFYRGEIQGEPNSTAVFNLCNGLVSTFVLFTYVVIIDVLIRALICKDLFYTTAQRCECTVTLFLFLTAHRSVILIRFRTIPCDSHSCDENIWKNYHFVTDGGILFYLCTQLTRPVRPTFSQGHVN